MRSAMNLKANSNSNANSNFCRKKTRVLWTRLKYWAETKGSEKQKPNILEIFTLRDEQS